jgi:2-keto-3-deoxy-6-phosphogluconate aldolase
LDSLRAAISGPTEKYTLSHKGAIDHDWLDNWLAHQLGAQPRSRFRAHA